MAILNKSQKVRVARTLGIYLTKEDSNTFNELLDKVFADSKSDDNKSDDNKSDDSTKQTPTPLGVAK